MKKICIIKTGTTFNSTASRFGDFDDWTIFGLSIPQKQVDVVNVFKNEPLPSAGECAGVVITGSHDMVTDDLDWSLGVEKWLKSALVEMASSFPHLVAI